MNPPPGHTESPPPGRTESQAPANWKETIEADPLGLVTHREWEPQSEQPVATQRAGLVRLILVLGAILAFGYAAGVGETVLLVYVLIGCIVAHEFGHYLAAKTGKVKVTEFFVGFGPRLWSIRRGETEYGVKGLPFGGYCRIVGMNNLEEVPPDDEPRTYRKAPLWRRLLIDVAGPGMNFLIGITVLFAMFFWIGDNGNYLKQPQTPANAPIAQILAFTGGPSPAQIAGLHAGDRIEAIDGRKFPNYDALGRTIQASAGKTLDLTVDRHGKLLDLHVTPVAADTVHFSGDDQLPAGKAGFIGIAVDPIVLVHSSFTASISHAGSAVGWITTTTLSAIGRLFSPHGVSSYFHILTNQKAADTTTASSVRFASPVKVVELFHQESAYGLSSVLWLIGLINISLGLLNLAPIFPLDGGRIVVGIYEGVRGLWRPRYRVDMAKLLPVLYVGLLLVLFIGASSLFLDLRDLAS